MQQESFMKMMERNFKRFEATLHRIDKGMEKMQTEVDRIKKQVKIDR